MGIKFALRGDSLDARYSTEGASPGILGSADPAEVTTDEPGINGVNSIDQVGVAAGGRPLLYNGRTNTPSGLNRSMLLRCKQASAGSNALMAMGVLYRNAGNYLGINSTAAGEVTVFVGNVGGGTYTATSTGAALGTTAWKDIGVTWDGKTTAGGLEVFVDGVSVLSATSTRSLPDPYKASDQLVCGNIFVGANNVYVNAHQSVDEVVIWDEIIDFTAAQNLTTGTGVLNGASRAYYLEVDAYDGTVSTGSGGINLGGISV